MSWVVPVGVAMVLAAQGAARSAPQMWLDAPAELRCPDGDAVLAALRAHLGERVGRGRAAAPGFLLRLTPRGVRGVKMSLRRAGAVLVERSIDVGDGECGALAETLALMVQAWMAPEATPAERWPPDRPAARETEPAPTPPEPPVEGEAAGNAETTAAGPIAAVADDQGPDSVASPIRTTPAPTTSAVPAASPAPPALPVGAPVVARSPLAPAPPVPFFSATLGADAGAVVALATRAAVTATTRADLHVVRRRWRWGLWAAVESAADLDPSAGEVRARHLPAAGYVGHRFTRWGCFDAIAVAGAGVDFVFARTAGYVAPRSFSAVDPLALAGLRGEWLVSRHVAVTAAADLLVALRREQFVVANAASVAHTSRARAGLALGVAWHLP